MQTDLLLSTVRAIIFGHAIADALGVPAEFESREKLHRSPMLDYQGYGRILYPPVHGLMIPV